MLVVGTGICAAVRNISAFLSALFFWLMNIVFEVPGKVYVGAQGLSEVKQTP